MEPIVPGSIIVIGKKEQTRAVVCTIRPGRVEVVYLDSSGKALHQEVRWCRDSWDFIAGIQAGRPAEKDTRLERYVKILRTLQ